MSNKILILAFLGVSINITGARLRSDELRRGTASERPKSGFFSKISDKYKAYNKEKKEQKEKNRVINLIFDYCLDSEFHGQDVGPQMNQLEDLTKQNPWALESKNSTWTIEQMTPMGQTNSRAAKRRATYNTHFQETYEYITPLQKAIANFQFFPWITSVKEIETLLSLDANINVLDKAGNTPILNILDPVQRANAFWIPIVFKMLLDKDADLTVKNKFGETVSAKISKLPPEYAKILFGLIDEKQTKPEAKKVLGASLPVVISNLICEYISAKDSRKLELDAASKEDLGKYASFYQ